MGYSLWGHKGLDTTEQLNKFRSTATVLFLSLPSRYRGVFHYIYLNFIHVSVDGHLGCFHVLAIVNSTAVNNGAHVSL